MRSPFNELDHRLSVTKRWSILHTIQTQSNAEHCFNVARIAAAIWVPWLQGRSDQLADIYEWALHHDDEEVFTGDIQSPVKAYFDVDAFRKDHTYLLRVPGPLNTDVKNCVKLADLMEMYHFLTMERLLGNKFIEDHRVKRFEKMTKFAAQTYGTDVMDKTVSWADEIIQSKSQLWVEK